VEESVATPVGSKPSGSGAAQPRPDAAAALATAPLTEPARARLAPGRSGTEFVAALVAAELLEDAVRATAFLLPRREAVWWAARCVRSVPAAVADPKSAAALSAAEAWAGEPTDANRRSAFAAAEIAGVGTPAGAVGAAVFFAEGSLAPPKQPTVPPPPHLTPTTVANAVLLAAVVSEPERAAERRRQFVALGEGVSAGSDRWPEPRPKVGPAPGMNPPPRRN
jgi:hypothetical protein